MGLDVYLSGKRIGFLSPGEEGGCNFAYAPELIEEIADGSVDPATAQLSRSLPVRTEPYGPEETRPYIEGLLPEGVRRETIATELCIDPTDLYALIAELGRDCPGAVVFVPQGEPVERHDAGSLAVLSKDELVQVVGAPERGLIDPAHPQRMRFALPGEGHKLALVRDEAGDRWAWPEPGAPSTHIVEPEPGDMPHFAINAMACTSAVRRLGLPIAHSELMTIGGRRCLVSRRFDRWGEGADAVRVHQESFFQALGILPGSAEAKDFGYLQSCALLREIEEEAAIETLFALAFCHHLLGSGRSVHGKRSALLYAPEGPLLAPCSDIASTTVYDPAREQPSVFGLVRRTSNQPKLAPSAIANDFEFQPSVVNGLQTAAGLVEALRAVGQQAREEGWYSRLIDHIPPRANPHSFSLGHGAFEF
jgi:serine/threonine-protein kinase HipA